MDFSLEFALGLRARNGPGLVTELSWFAVLDGMGVRPQDYDPLVDCSSGWQQVGAQPA